MSSHSRYFIIIPLFCLATTLGACNRSGMKPVADLNSDQDAFDREILESDSDRAETTQTAKPEEMDISPTKVGEIGEEDQTIEDEPRVVPGAAPDFKSQAKEKLSLADSIRTPQFLRNVLKWIKNLQPNQGGIITIASIITVLVAFNFRKLGSWWNFDILLLLMPSFFLIDLIPLGNLPEDPTQTTLFGFLFACLFITTIVLFVRALMRAFSSYSGSWVPTLSKSALIVLTITLLASNIFLALVRRPDDAGAFTNIGAAQMLKTGKFPYGDSTLRGGAAATYGPILYLSHIPFQMMLSPLSTLTDLDENSNLRRIVMGTDDSQYDGPPNLATKLAVILFHVLGVVGLIAVGRRLAHPSVGWALACLYVGSAYVQGIGGEDYYITGMTFISHIAPAAITILAFLVLQRPLLAGCLLAVAAGMLFYPAFFFPLWLGYYLWKRKGWVKFALSFIIVSGIILTSALLLTQPSETESTLRVIYESTVGHQESKAAYGSSTFSFWGTQPRLASFWQQPFIQNQYLLRPSFLLFSVFIVATFFMARNRTIPQLAFLTAAVALAIQLWKSHAGGTYVEWYYPFFLIGLLAQQRSDTTDQII